MPIIVIHGNGIVGIGNKIKQIKSGFDPLSIQEFSSKQTSFQSAVIELSTPNLFGGKRLVILEDFDEKIDLNKLPQDADLTIIIKFQKSLSASSQVLKDAHIIKAQIIPITEAEETNIFPFLDKLAEKNPKALEELDELFDEFGSQYLLTMIFYLLRRFILPSKTSSSFMQQKIEKQKRNFTQEIIKQLYKESLETDFKIKKGLIDDQVGITLLVHSFLAA